MELLPAGADIAALLVAASRDAEVVRWTQVPADLTLHDAALVTAGWAAASPSIARFRVATPALPAAGMVTVWIDAGGRAEVGYWLLEAARGHGVGRRALALLCDWSFEACRLPTLQLTTLPGNLPSEHVAAACGFHRDGTLVRDIKGRARTLQRWARSAGPVAAVSAR